MEERWAKAFQSMRMPWDQQIQGGHRFVVIVDVHKKGLGSLG
jgi:hypothetical protein